MNTNNDYKDLGGNFISCCADCFPGNAIIARYPELAGKTISHGICAAHKIEFLVKLAGFKYAPMTATVAAVAPVTAEFLIGAL